MINLNSTSRYTKAQQLDYLNEVFTPLSFRKRLETLYKLFSEDEVLVTSSFGTKSVFLLHLLSQIQPRQAVHFIDTGYHFSETLSYKKQLAEHLQLRVIDVHPESKAHTRTRSTQLWQHAPDQCCAVNKVEPLERIKPGFRVWISGLMSYQTDFRSEQRVFEWDGHLLKFHPLIDIDEGEFLYHLSYYNLPRHPLEEVGYGSVGCTHCTAKGEGRSGRWQGQGKTECGLHPGYFANKMRQ